MTIQAKDYGFSLAVAEGFADGAALAGGTGDATAKAGAIIDLLTLDHPLSGLVVIPWTATLADTESISMVMKIEHGDESDLSDAEDYTFGPPGNLVAEVDFGVLATSSGGTTESGVATSRMDLSGLKRYWRVEVTPDLSASGTDTAEFSACVVLGGLDKAS